MNDKQNIAYKHEIFDEYLDEINNRRTQIGELSEADEGFISEAERIIKLNADNIDTAKSETQKALVKYERSRIAIDRISDRIYKGVNIEEGYLLVKDTVDKLNDDIKKAEETFASNREKILSWPPDKYVSETRIPPKFGVTLLSIALTIPIALQIPPFIEKETPTPVYLEYSNRDYVVSMPKEAQDIQQKTVEDIKTLKAIHKITFDNPTKQFEVKQNEYTAIKTADPEEKPYTIYELNQGDIKTRYELDIDSYYPISMPEPAQTMLNALKQADSNNKAVATAINALKSIQFYVHKDNTDKIAEEGPFYKHGGGITAVYFVSQDEANKWDLGTADNIASITDGKDGLLLSSLLCTNGWRYRSSALKLFFRSFVGDSVMYTYAVDGNLNSFAAAVATATEYSQQDVIDLITYYDQHYKKINAGELFEKMSERIKDKQNASEILAWLEKEIVKVKEPDYPVSPRPVNPTGKEVIYVTVIQKNEVQ